MDKLGVIGGGVMGSILVTQIIKSGLLTPQNIYLVETDQAKCQKLQSELKIQIKEGLTQLALECQTIILAVKPQVLTSVLKELSPSIKPSHLLISIAAGVSIASLESQIPQAKIIRVMPNIPAKVGKGVSAYCCGAKVTDVDRQTVTALFNCTGTVVSVNETAMHVVTAISGSGPAYVYYFIESLIDAGVMQGLTRDVAAVLVQETVIGAAELLKTSGEHPAKLRNDVTSAGGTTAAALYELEKAAVTGALMNAVTAAVQRSKDLAASTG